MRVLKQTMLHLILAAVAFSGPGAVQASKGTPKAATAIHSALAAISREEKALHCIALDALWQNEHYNGHGKVVKNLLVRSNVILVGVPSGKFRWMASDFYAWGSPGPTIERFESAFDGAVYTHLLVAVSHGNGRWFDFNQGSVATKPGPGGRLAYSFSGWDQTIFGFTSTVSKLPGQPDFRRYLFSQYISPTGQPKIEDAPAITVSPEWVKRAGHRLLDVTRVGGLGVVRFYLDPKKGYAIRYFSQRTWRAKKKPGGGYLLLTGGPLCERFTASKFKEILPGTFFPQLISGESYRSHPRPGEPRWNVKSTLHISQIRVNSAVHLRKGMFVVTFPRGAQVTDARTGKTIIVGGTLKQQMEEIEKAVGKERSQVKSR
jgi:hypothetical protein